MVSRIIKVIEDLNYMEEHRTVKDNYEFPRQVRMRLGREVKKPTEHEDEQLMEVLRSATKKFLEGLNNPNDRSDATLKALFAELVKDVQPVKSAILNKDPSEWSKAFSATGAIPQAAASESEAAPEAAPEAAASGAGYAAEPVPTVSAATEDMLTINVQTMGGNSLFISCAPSQTLADLKLQLFKCGGPKPRDQKVVMGTSSEGSEHDSLAALGLKSGDDIMLLCTPYCECCLGACKCIDCHGEGRYGDGCATCGYVRPPCQACKGECKCPDCHGKNARRGCPTCGIRPPCWGGDTFVFQPDGCTKKIRDCQVGDMVRTLRGSKRIARIWGRDPSLPQNVDTEVVCLDGVWITSHHPVIDGDRWRFPTEIKASAPWIKRQHIVPDMFNFELEGHDDTILLWGGGGLVVSCTIGKYLGPRFGNGICTRRSTRCQHSCAQCDAVYMEGLAHNNIDSELRWARFPDFPQVEWSDGISEFELAATASQNFVAPKLTTSCAREAQAMTVFTLAPVCVTCSQ